MLLKWGIDSSIIVRNFMIKGPNSYLGFVVVWRSDTNEILGKLDRKGWRKPRISGFEGGRNPTQGMLFELGVRCDLRRQVAACLPPDARSCASDLRRVMTL